MELEFQERKKKRKQEIQGLEWLKNSCDLFLEGNKMESALV